MWYGPITYFISFWHMIGKIIIYLVMFWLVIQLLPNPDSSKLRKLYKSVRVGCMLTTMLKISHTISSLWRFVILKLNRSILKTKKFRAKSIEPVFVFIRLDRQVLYYSELFSNPWLKQLCSFWICNTRALSFAIDSFYHLHQ